MLESVKLVNGSEWTERTVDTALTVLGMANAMALGHKCGLLGPYYGRYNHTGEAQRERAQGEGPHNPTVLSRPCPAQPGPLATLSAPPRCTCTCARHASGLCAPTLCAVVPYLRRHRDGESRRAASQAPEDGQHV